MKLISTEQAAEMLGAKPSTLRNWRCAKTGPPFIQITKRSVKYIQEDIEKYVAERRFTPSVRPSEVNHSLTRDAMPPPGSPAWHRRNRTS